MEATSRIELIGAGYLFGEGSFALKDINIAIKPGEFIGVLGSNGSGKTTLLSLMDGMLKGYDGSVRLDGAEISRLTPREIYSRVGLVFQNPDSQLFGGTIEEDVAFGPMNMGVPKPEIKDRIAYALEAVDMAGLQKSRIAHLSFGQKKRICIAGLLAMGHEILLLDEPTAGLDPMGEYRMMDLLMGLNKNKGVTVIMASHSVDLVPLFLDRLYILSKGVVKRSGTPEQVFNAPQDMREVKLRLPHVAELIWKLREHDGVQFKKLPLTVGEARRMLLEKLNG